MSGSHTEQTLDLLQTHTSQSHHCHLAGPTEREREGGETERGTERGQREREREREREGGREIERESEEGGEKNCIDTHKSQ